MRIRKHAKLAGISLTATVPSGSCGDVTPHGSSYHCPPRHICQLNQSPWDLLSFPPDSPSSPFQVDGEESFNYTANGSSANSLGAVESGASMRISMDVEDKNFNHDNNNGVGLGFGNGGMSSCRKNIGKGSKCKMEASKGHYSLCQHHLPHHDQLRATDSLTENPVTAPPIRRRGRPRKERAVPSTPPEAAAAAKNPYEFYYYSGFGPRWGRKRGVSHLAKSERVEEKEEEEEINVRERVLPHSSVLLSSSEIDSDEFDDYVEDKKEEFEGINHGNTKKMMRRGRKPIKARSLKSLM